MEDECMKKIRKKAMAWLLSFVMVLSLCVNVSYDMAAQESGGLEGVTTEMESTDVIITDDVSEEGESTEIASTEFTSAESVSTETVSTEATSTENVITETVGTEATSTESVSTEGTNTEAVVIVENGIVEGADLNGAAGEYELTQAQITVTTYVNNQEVIIDANTVLENGDKVKIQMDWAVSNTDSTPITPETDITFPLASAGVVVANSSGSVLQNGIAVGTYTIDGNGKLHMKITDSTLLEKSNITGGLEIDATIDTSKLTEDDKGMSSVKIGTQTIAVQVTNPETMPTVYKARSGDGVYVDADGKYCQDFTVTFTENSNANYITLTDTFGGYLSYKPGTFKVDGNTANDPTVNGNEITYTVNTPEKGKQYTVSYTAFVDTQAFGSNYWGSSEEKAYYNTAKVTNSNGKTASSETFALGYKNWVTKWGSYDAKNDTIFWCITVNDGDKSPLKGAILKDVLPAGTEITGNINIKDSSGNLVASFGEDDKDLGNYQFPDSYVGKYTIEYSTTTTGSGTGLENTAYTNTAKIQTPTGNIYEAPATVYVKDDWLTKTYASVDTTNNIITWEAVITIPDSQTTPINLTFSDTLGENLDYKPGTFNVKHNGDDITPAGDITVDANKTFTVPLTGLSYKQGKTNKVVITYKTEFTVPDGVKQYDYVNKATITDPNGNKESETSTYRYTTSDVNIVPYKWHNGTNGTTVSWGVQVQGANNYYDDVVDDNKKVYIYDTPTITKTDGTEIPNAGFTVVPGSIKVGGNATDLITAQVSNGTIVFDITEYIRNNPNGIHYFELYYSIALDANTVRYMLENDISQANMSNEVSAFLMSSDGSNQEKELGSTVANGTGTPSIGTLLSKSYTYDSTTAPYANYVIDINPQALDLVDGTGTLSLEDVMGKSLQLDIGSVKLMAVGDNNTTSSISGINSSFDSTTNTLTIHNIPDATHCRLTYTVRVNVTHTDSNPTFESLGNAVDVGNACSLYANNETFSENSVKLTGTIQKSSAWADSEYGSIRLSKYSGITPLGGAKFEVKAYEIVDGQVVHNADYNDEYKSKGVSVGEVTTGADGMKTVNLLYDILYTVEETEAPAGYVKTDQVYYVVLPGKDYASVQATIESYVSAKNGTLNVVSSGENIYVENKEQSQYSIQIVKSDQFGDYVEGAEFTLHKKNDNGVYEVANDSEGNFIVGTTDSYGRITFNNLDEGDYKVVESKIPNGYDKSNTVSQDGIILSENNKAPTINLTNDKLYGEWTINKVELDNASNKLAGVTFEITKAGETNPFATKKTDSNGQVVFDKLELGVEYTVKESATIDGYILNNTEYTFIPSENALEQIDTIENEKEAGKIQITKTDKDDSNTKVVGATYTLYDANKKIVYDANNKPVTATTNDNGIATFTDLRFGTYYVRETEAPADYKLDTEFYEVVVNSNTVVEKATTNEKKTIVSPFMSFKFKKQAYDETGNTLVDLAGAEFTLYRRNLDGSSTPVDTAISDSEGYVYFLNVTTYDVANATNPIQYYQYYIVESGIPTGYQSEASTNALSIDAEALSFYHHQNDDYTLAEKDKVNALTSDYSSSGSETTIYNYKTVGRVELQKNNNYGNGLAGARFAAYREGKEAPVAQAISDSTGKVVFTGLEYGVTYTFKEIEAPDGYSLSYKEIEVKIGDTPVETGKYNSSNNIPNTINNVYVYKNTSPLDTAYTVEDKVLALDISKQSLTGSAEVYGASLKLTDAQGNLIDSWTSTTKAHSISSSKLKVNTIYTLTETAAPDGYGYSDSISFKFNEDGTVQLMDNSDSNAEVITNANASTNTVIMKDKAMGFTVSKVDKLTGDRVPGAFLQICSVDGTILRGWFTANGQDYIVDSAMIANIGITVPSAKGEYAEYILKEYTAPSKYYKAEDIHFYLDYTGQMYTKNNAGTYVKVADNKLIMQDVPFSDDVIISKVNIAGGEELPGASLKIIDKTNNDTEIASWVSKTTAQVIDIDKFDTNHTYELIETGAPDGYKYSDSIQFKINNDGQVEIGGVVKTGNIITMVDDAISVKLSKKSDLNIMLQGAEITLYDEAGNVINVFTSGSDPIDIGSYLKVPSTASNVANPLNKYKLVETKVPFGYMKADDVYFAIDADGDLHTSSDLGATYSPLGINQITMVDDSQLIHISKYDLVNSREITGATLEITKVSDGSTVTSWVSNAVDGPKDLVIASLFKANEVYKLTETQVPYGYEIAESIEFYISEGGVLYTKLPDETGFTVANNNTIRMIDDVSKIYISKVDATNSKELPGAHLVIKSKAGSVVAEWDSTTEKRSIAMTQFVADADYILTETIAPYGYDIAESITFRITSDGVVQVKEGDSYIAVTDNTVVMKDNVRSAYFSKVDATNSEELSGASLTVTDASGKVIDTWTSGAKKHSIPLSEFEAEKEYTLTEKTAPYGYEIAESIVFKVDKDGNVLTKNANGVFTKVDANTVVMKDEPMYISISKVDMANKKELPGASLKVTDKSGKVIDSWTSSNAVHKILVSSFAQGEEYTLTETTAPKGYEIAESIMFKLDESGNVYVKIDDKWTAVTGGTVVMEDKAITSEETTETTETTTTTQETTEATTTTEETIGGGGSGGMDDSSDGSGTPGTPDTSETTDTSDTPTTSTTDTPTTSTDTHVKTGDDTPIYQILILMMLSIAGILIIERRKKVRC